MHQHRHTQHRHRRRALLHGPVGRAAVLKSVGLGRGQHGGYFGGAQEAGRSVEGRVLRQSRVQELPSAQARSRTKRRKRPGEFDAH